MSLSGGPHAPSPALRRRGGSNIIASPLKAVLFLAQSTGKRIT
jgi:hypothetical protein